jgi:hypothetical protein
MSATYDSTYESAQLHADVEAGKVSGFYGGSYISYKGYKSAIFMTVEPDLLNLCRSPNLSLWQTIPTQAILLK